MDSILSLKIIKHNQNHGLGKPRVRFLENYLVINALENLRECNGKILNALNDNFMNESDEVSEFYIYEENKIYFKNLK